MSSIVTGVPDIGMSRKIERDTDIPVWWVDLSIHYMTTAQTRQLAAELLNMADAVDGLNRAISLDKDDLR